MLDGSTPRVFRHTVYGLTIESEFALGSLAPTHDQAAADVRLRRAPDGYFADHGGQGPGGTWYRYRSLADGGVRIGIPGVLDAEVSADGCTALCAPAPGGDERAFEANVLHFVLTIALTLKGEEPLHATVVALGGHAVGLLGDSGLGKSTLAAYLLTEGATLVTDDMLRVGCRGGRPIAHRGPPRLKLFDQDARLLLSDAARDASFNPLSGKLLVEANACASVEAPVLSALVLLESSPDRSEASLRRLQGGEAVRAVLASTLHRDHRPTARMASQLGLIERMVRSVPLFALDYPRHHAFLPMVAAALRRCV